MLVNKDFQTRHLIGWQRYIFHCHISTSADVASAVSFTGNWAQTMEGCILERRRPKREECLILLTETILSWLAGIDRKMGLIHIKQTFNQSHLYKNGRVNEHNNLRIFSRIFRGRVNGLLLLVLSHIIADMYLKLYDGEQVGLLISMWSLVPERLKLINW